MTKTAVTSSLSLNGLQLSVFLGVYPEERLQKQTVSLDSHIRFPEPPKACESDLLEETYCYDKLIKSLKSNLENRKFQLIEHLAQELHVLLKSYFPPFSAISIRVTKKPAISELTQGVTFEYGDGPFLWSS
jgi:dihydroneopterin aldolase